MASMTIAQALQLALQHLQGGRLREAEPLYLAILQHDPNNATAMHLLGVIAQQTGKPAAAIEWIRKAIAADPNQPDFRANLGLILISTGQAKLAIGELLAGLRIAPQHPDLHGNLGYAFCEVREFAQSIEHSKTAIALRPAFPEAFNNLGNAYSGLQQFGPAIDAYRKAIELRPSFAGALSNLANLLNERSRAEEALEFARRAILADGNWLSAYVVAGNALRDLGRLQEAAAMFLKAAVLQPASAEACSNVSTIFRELDQMDESIAMSRRAIELNPHYAAAYSNLAGSLVDTGRLDEAFEVYENALHLAPTAPDILSNLLFVEQFSPTHCNMSSMQTQRCRYQQAIGEPLRESLRPHDNDRDADRKLKIGFVSPDFFDHVQSFFTIPLLKNLDRSKLEISAYASQRKSDSTTDRIRVLADHWRPISHLSDEQAVDLIRQDRIDILIDLTQHMAGNRLPIFARKPAPVQVSWLGYPGSTGLEAIDYRLSDSHLDPPDMFDRFHSEKTLRLPETFWCYDSLDTDIEVNELPMLRAGHVTFGCLNNFAKVNEGVLRLFAETLKSISNSRLLILARKGSHRKSTLDRFIANGVDPARIEFIDRATRKGYLEYYHRIDLSLDTFPYNGHTTSIDSLWMGVPVVTLVDQTPVGRAGLSIYSNLQMPEMVARSQAEYVQIAQSLASDPARLAGLRQTLRQRITSSPLMEAPRFARGFEAALRDMWRRWCGGL